MKVSSTVTEVTGVTETTHIAPLILRDDWLPVITTDGISCLEESLDPHHPNPYRYSFLPARLRELAERPTIWATMQPPSLFMALYNHYARDDDWFFKGNVSAKELRPGLGVGTVGATIRQIGFRRTKQGQGMQGSASRNSRMHYLLDLRGFTTVKDPTIGEQYKLALEVRDFCFELGISPKTNFAGIAAALLRHPDFYPEPRKRVPEFINEKARLHLPGNHYDLFTETGRVYKSASYFDQRSAHHHAALLAPMPTSDSLRGKGYTRTGDEGGGKLWLTPEHPAWDAALAEYGLFMARAVVPGHAEGDERYMPHSMRQPGIQSVPIWSSELPWLREMGIKLLGLEWALTGNEIDEGIRRYAEWALATAQQHPNFKSTLLCTYGLLAQRRGWARSIRGTGRTTVRWDTKTFRANVALGGPVQEFHTHGPVNVVQRGIIEAYTRMLTLRYVSHVPKNMQLGLYGDAVLIDTGDREYIAPIEEPWREKGNLTNLQFDSATQFRSDQLTRLPGVRPGKRR